MRVMKYVDVIIPLRFRDSVTYSVPQELEGRIVPGSIVKVTVVGRSYTAVVLRVKDVPGFDPSKIIPLRDVVKFPPVTQANMDFLRQVASYYMCSLGEAFRFAAPSTVKALKRDKARDADVEEATGNVSGGPEPAGVALPVLSEEQAQAVDSIRNLFSSGNNVLLHGVTGSGKTEIYVTLADECLRNGRSVLCLVPEIALSRQIQKRLEAHFPDRLLVYHSKQTAAHKREVYERVASCTECSEPYVILGLRSALFLPYRNLGLIIVDEEHDTSYKQTDQAPRYHGRDTALMLGRIMHCPVLLGSATPSFESLFNVQVGQFRGAGGHEKGKTKECGEGPVFPDFAKGYSRAFGKTRAGLDFPFTKGVCIRCRMRRVRGCAQMSEMQYSAQLPQVQSQPVVPLLRLHRVISCCLSRMRRGFATTVGRRYREDRGDPA